MRGPQRPHQHARAVNGFAHVALSERGARALDLERDLKRQIWRPATVRLDQLDRDLGAVLTLGTHSAGGLVAIELSRS